MNAEPATALPAALSSFSLLPRGRLRTVAGNGAVGIVVLLLADWLLGTSAFVGDPFRLTALATVIVELIIVVMLFDRVPIALRTLWERGLLGASRNGEPAPEALPKFLSGIDKHNNSGYAWWLGAALAVAGLFATYPVRYYFANNGQWPYSLEGLIWYYTLGNAAFVVVPIGVLVGLLAWRVGVVAWLITQLGERFELSIEPNHPDRAGGLKPLGELCLLIALLLLLPAIYLSSWGVATVFIQTPGTAIYAALWSGLFKKWLALVSVAAFVLFFRPLQSVHRQMQAQRILIQAELNELTRKIGQVSHRLRTDADSMSPEEGAKKLEGLKFMQKVYEENSRVPTWPFDWNILIRFAAAQAVPLLNLTGTSAAAIKFVESLVTFLRP